MLMNRVVVVIPMFNCERQISRVLEKFKIVPSNTFSEVLIIDNRSTDNSIDFAINSIFCISKDVKVSIIKNNENYGFGGSMKVGFHYAISNDYDHLVVLHGDDQANINEIVPVLKNEHNLSIDCIIGSRFMGGSRLEGYSYIKRIGNKFFNLIFTLMTGKKIPELGSGLIAYKTTFFNLDWINRLPDDTSFVYVILLYMLEMKCDIKFFPISWREDDQVSNVRLIHQTLETLSYIANYIFLRESFLNKDFRKNKLVFYRYELVFSRS